MNNLKFYKTFCKGNIDKTEIIKIKICTHESINDILLKQINELSCDEVYKLAKIKKWQIFIIRD